MANGQREAVTQVAERFLQEERAHSGPRIDPLDRARFHHLVKLCADVWRKHDETGLRISRGKHGISLLFDGPIGGRRIALFSLRVDYKKAEYRFAGPNADRERMGLDQDSLEILERLRDLYGALLSEAPTSDLVITRVLKGKPFPDLLPLVEETRRVLDGAQEGAGATARKARKQAREAARLKAEGKAEGAPPARAEKKRKTTEAEVTEIILSCPDPKASAAFYRRIFGVKSLPKRRPEDHAIYTMGGVDLVLRRELTSEERRKLGIGSVQRNRGWGIAIVIDVPDYDACLRRVRRVPDALVSEDPERRVMLVRDPAGYILEVHDAG